MPGAVITVLIFYILGTEASFDLMYGIIIDERDDSLLVCDYGNRMVRRVTQQGKKPTLYKTNHTKFS